jgi:hypothetical protein
MSVELPAKMTGPNLRVRNIKPRFAWLVISQIILIVCSPILHELESLGILIIALLETAVPLTLILAFSSDRRHFRYTLLLAVFFIFFNWSNAVFGGHLFRFASYGLGALFCLYALSIMLGYMFRQSVVTTDTVLGGISIYLLLGQFYAILFGLIERIHPGSFFSSNTLDLTYYSFVALTSTGYGDIVPITAFARSVAILETVTGVLYIAIFVGSLVGLRIAQRAEPVDKSGTVPHSKDAP